MTPRLGVEPGPHWWKARALTTVPPLHSNITPFVQVNGEMCGERDFELKSVEVAMESRNKALNLKLELFWF